MYKITVAICCYKQKNWLYRTLRSLASQTISKDDFEVIVVNDDPEETLEEVCDNMKEHLNITLINNDKNLGLPGSLNEILKVAKGWFFVRVDSDDFVSKHFLYMLSNFLIMNDEYQAISSDYKKVDEVGRDKGKFSFKKDPIACGIMFTYESLCNLGFYDEEFKMREGHDLLQRFKDKYKVYHLEVPLYRYRIHNSNRTYDIDSIKFYDNKL